MNLKSDREKAELAEIAKRTREADFVSFRQEIANQLQAQRAIDSEEARKLVILEQEKFTVMSKNMADQQQQMFNEFSSKLAESNSREEQFKKQLQDTNTALLQNKQQSETVIDSITQQAHVQIQKEQQAAEARILEERKGGTRH